MENPQFPVGPGEPPPRSEPVFDLPFPLVALIGVLVVIEIWRGFLDPASDGRLVATFAFVPDRLLFEDGEPVYPGGFGAVVWTFLSYGFLHQGWTHLAFNSAMLAALGRVVIHRIGAARTLLMLAFATVAGAVAHLGVAWGEGAPMVGASGAVSGLLGALPRFVFRPPGWPAPGIVETLRDSRARGFVLALVIVNLVLVVFGTGPFGGGAGEVAWAAHFGGFLFGFLAFDLFDRPSPAFRDGRFESEP